MSAVVPFPCNPAHFHAGIKAVHTRAKAVQATPEELRNAKLIFTREHSSGRSTAAAVALANASFRRVRPASPFPGDAA